MNVPGMLNISSHASAVEALAALAPRSIAPSIAPDIYSFGARSISRMPALVRWARNSWPNALTGLVASYSSIMLQPFMSRYSVRPDATEFVMRSVLSTVDQLAPPCESQTQAEHERPETGKSGRAKAAVSCGLGRAAAGGRRCAAGGRRCAAGGGRPADGAWLGAGHHGGAGWFPGRTAAYRWEGSAARWLGRLG